MMLTDLLHGIVEQLVDEYGAESVLRAFTDTSAARRWLIDESELHFKFEDDFGSDDKTDVRSSWELRCIPGCMTIVTPRDSKET